MILSTVGVAEISADIRLTFGSQVMIGGFGVVGALIGLYCIPVLIDLVATPERHLKVEENVKSVRISEAFKIAMRSKFNLIRSSVVGTLVGIYLAPADPSQALLRTLKQNELVKITKNLVRVSQMEL